MFYRNDKAKKYVVFLSGYEIIIYKIVMAQALLFILIILKVKFF